MLSEVKGCILSLRSSDFTKKRTINKYHAAQYSGKGNGTPLQYSCLENPMDGGAWWAAVHGIAKSQTQLSDFTFTFYFYAVEKKMATHSSVLAWRIPGTGEPGGLPSVGSHRVGHVQQQQQHYFFGFRLLFVFTRGKSASEEQVLCIMDTLSTIK